MSATISAKTRTGTTKRFETELCFERHGFNVGDRVHTPKGDAWVVGAHGGNLYFQIDGDKGASKWPGHTKHDFDSRGFKLLYSATLVSEAKAKKHNAPEFRTLVNNPAYSDVEFLLDDGRKVYGMKGILCARSEYFRALFKPVHKEGAAKEVPMQGIRYETFVDVMEYLYTGDVHISEQAAVDLVRAADMFMLEHLKAQVANVLIHQINTDSVLPLFKLSGQHDLYKLKDHCKQYLVSALKDDQNKGLKEKFKSFISSENADLIYELTVASCVNFSDGASNDTAAFVPLSRASLAPWVSPISPSRAPAASGASVPTLAPAVQSATDGTRENGATVSAATGNTVAPVESDMGVPSSSGSGAQDSAAASSASAAASAVSSTAAALEALASALDIEPLDSDPHSATKRRRLED